MSSSRIYRHGVCIIQDIFEEVVNFTSSLDFTVSHTSDTARLVR